MAAQLREVTMKIETCRAVVLGALAVALLACGSEEPAVQPTDAEPASESPVTAESAAPAASTSAVEDKPINFDAPLMCRLVTADDVAQAFGREFQPGRPSRGSGCLFASTDQEEGDNVILVGYGSIQPPVSFGRGSEQTGASYDQAYARGERCEGFFEEVESLPVRAFRTWGDCGQGSALTFEAGPQGTLQVVAEKDPEASPDALRTLADRALDGLKNL
jgi:hypothetical protein